MNCKHMEEILPLYLYEELSDAERAALEAHLASCARCAEAARELGRLREVATQRPMREPTPELLVRCRADLEEALDREEHGWRALVRGWFGQAPGQPALRAASALALLTLGFSMGWMMQRPAGTTTRTSPGEPAMAWIGDLSGLRINGISQVTPDPQTGEVRLTVNAERQVTLQGSLDDPRIQQLLLATIKSNDNPGIRHDTLEALRLHSDNPHVREALLHALRHDPNPGVRLEALEALRPAAGHPQVRAALIEVLKSDDNPGVRVTAIDILVEHAGEEDLPALEEMAREHKNAYVRLRCSKALRERAGTEQ